jgi:hypothetical protein
MIARNGILAGTLLAFGWAQTAFGQWADSVRTEGPNRFSNAPSEFVPFSHAGYPIGPQSRQTVEYEANHNAPVCESIDCAIADCPQAFRLGIVTYYGYETFRGIPDGGWANYGAHAGANLGFRLGNLTDATGIHAQAGANIGVFNWSGNDYRMFRQDDPQTQGIGTYGLYRRADAENRWSGAVVHDWMLNTTVGVFGMNPTISQLRAQLGYALSDWDEIGVWGAVGVTKDSRDVPGFGETTWQAIDQLSAFWHHKWEYGADTLIWVGVPERSRITGDGSLGDYYVGARVDAPLNDRIAGYAHVTYVHPSAHIGPSAAQEDEWSFIVGLSWYPRRDSRAPTVAGHPWQPLMPVATNGLFLVDTDNWY